MEKPINSTGKDAEEDGRTRHDSIPEPPTAGPSPSLTIPQHVFPQHSCPIQFIAIEEPRVRKVRRPPLSQNDGTSNGPQSRPDERNEAKRGVKSAAATTPKFILANMELMSMEPILAMAKGQWLAVQKAGCMHELPKDMKASAVLTGLKIGGEFVYLVKWGRKCPGVRVTCVTSQVPDETGGVRLVPRTVFFKDVENITLALKCFEAHPKWFKFGQLQL